MHLSDRRELAVLAFDRHNDDLGVLQQRHVHLIGVTPKSEQRQVACRKLPGELYTGSRKEGSTLLSACPLWTDKPFAETRTPAL